MVARSAMRFSLLYWDTGYTCWPNAQTHLPPEAGARHERTLEAVRCSAWFGAVAWPRKLLCPTSPDEHLGAHHQLPIGLECRQSCLHLLPYCPATPFG